jgi:hypothetical protein
MSRRRSRSQRPPKAGTSEAPAPKGAALSAAADSVEELAPEPASATPTDELAAVDAGWDELLS